MGIKNVAKRHLYCPYYEPLEEAFHPQSLEIHEKLKLEVKKLMETKYGVKCQDHEEPVTLPNGKKGKIDILCHGDTGDIVIEVKSSRISNLDLTDLVQLALYGYAYEQNLKGHKGKIDLYMVYRGQRDQPILIKIDGELLGSLRDLAIYIGSKKSPSETNPFRVIGYHCHFCADVKCPFKPKAIQVNAFE